MICHREEARRAGTTGTDSHGLRPEFARGVGPGGAREGQADARERIAPGEVPCAHDARRGGGNGCARRGTAFLDSSPMSPGGAERSLRGDRRRVVVLESDNHPRCRRVMVRVGDE